MSIIHEFSKNSQEKVIIQFQEYKGNEYLDIRVFYDPGGSNAEFRATPKGLKLNPDLLPELLQGLKKAAEILKE